MNIYETVVKEYRYVPIRVRANSANEADGIYEKFIKNESEYISEELDLNATVEINRTPFEEVHPTFWNEAATITMNEDGTFDACYEGGNE